MKPGLQILPTVGTWVGVLVSEPWEFEIASFTAEVVHVDVAGPQATVLLRVSPVVDHKGKPLEFFAGSRRHAEPTAGWEGTAFNLIPLSATDAERRPLDLSRWRGGTAVIASLSTATGPRPPRFHSEV